MIFVLRALLVAVVIASAALPARSAEPLSKNLPIDFFRDVPSRNLQGLATRSDGRLVSGPTLTDLDGPVLDDLLWCLKPAPGGKWLVGTGPEGKIFEVTLKGDAAYEVRDIADLEEPQIFALQPLRDGSLLVGTSPNGVLFRLRENAPVARATLPVDSIFDFVMLDEHTALVATGNPGRVYKIDLKKFIGKKEKDAPATDAKTDEELAALGITLFGEIRDRNVRRLALVGERLIAGSSPKGNVYAFTRSGGAPVLLQENRDAEVAALLPQSDGSFYAALVFTTTQGEARINRPGAGKDAPDPAPASADRFSGRSAVVLFPKDGGFPETVLNRNNVSLYALALRGSLLLMSGGEQGDLLAYDIDKRLNLSFSGSASAQLNELQPVPVRGNGLPQRFLALRNNTPGLAVVDFAAKGTREAETRRLDLGLPSRLGALHLSRIRGVDSQKIEVDVRTSWAGDETEGWQPWTRAPWREDGWLAHSPGRYVRVRWRLPAEADDVQLSDATLFYLPQNRRPVLNEFRLISPNFSLITSPEPANATMTTLGQIVGTDRERDEKRKGGLLSSTLLPTPGMQIAFWNVSDPDGDTLSYTFALRRDGTEKWTEVAVHSRESYAQFDIAHLEDGFYYTRLSVTEQAPRPATERTNIVFETDELVVDKTPPALSDLSVTREKDEVVVQVTGRDELSLLDGAEFVFNSGFKAELSHPADGILDSRVETFTLRVPLAQIAGATSVEVLVYDDLGNSSALRVAL